MERPDDYEELLYEAREEQRRNNRNLMHPDPRDPDHDHGDEEDED